MDCGRRNESKVASEDDDLNSPEQTDERSVPANVRYYNCIYCKRGFTCAQALGGHMNLHRKDRGRARQPPDPLGVERTEGRSGGYNEHYRSYENDGASIGDGGSRWRLRELSFYGEDLNWDDYEEKGQDEEDGVDLELRLGHDP